MVATKKETTAKKNIQATCFEIHIVLLNRFQTKYLGLSEQSHGSIQEDVKSASKDTLRELLEPEPDPAKYLR